MPINEQLLIDDIDVFVEGTGAQSIVMIHGWPDTHRVWDAQVAAFAASYRCVRFTLPGFDPAKPCRAYSLDEMMNIFAHIVERTCPNQKVILLLHDWGAVFGYQFCMTHPDLIARLIGVDIGDASSPEFLAALAPKAKLMIAGYQGWLSLAWRIGGDVGDAMTRFMARAMKARSEQRYISVKMNYPYYIKRNAAHGSYAALLPVAPACPMLFIYGQKKPFMFHSQPWVTQLASRPQNQVLGMATDHWPMRAAPDAFNQAVLQWLTAPAAS